MEAYLEAVGDTQSLYSQQSIVPPTALATRAIRELLTNLSLPPGFTHITQELESLAPCPTGTPLTLESHMA